MCGRRLVAFSDLSDQKVTFNIFEYYKIQHIPYDLGG